MAEQTQRTDFTQSKRLARTQLVGRRCVRALGGQQGSGGPASPGYLPRGKGGVFRRNDLAIGSTTMGLGHVLGMRLALADLLPASQSVPSGSTIHALCLGFCVAPGEREIRQSSAVGCPNPPCGVGACADM